MKKKQKISTIGALLCSACLAVSVGVANLNASAQTTTTPISSLISADSGVTVSKKDITATHYSRASTSETNSGTEYTYSGLAVESEVAYEGEFSGVFTGDTTLEYKFYGKTPWTSFSKLGTHIGDFYFTITSVADPSQWVQMNIIAGDPSLDEYSGYYKTTTYFTGSTFGDKVLYFQNNIVQNKTLSTMVYGYGYGPTFFSDAIGVNEKLYIEVDDNGYMYLSYQQIDQGSNGVLSATATKLKSINIVSLNGTNTSTSAKMDWSEGYTISFGSNVDTTKTHKYSTSSAKAPDGGTDVCFISLNGKELNTNTVSIESETIAMLDDAVLDVDTTYDVFQGSEHTIYSVTNGELYSGDYTDFDETTRNGAFTMRGKTKVGTLDTAELGNGKTFEVNGESYTYNVIKGEKGSDLVDINLETDGVSAEYQLHTGDNVASEYDGLTIEADKAYEGSFDGIFNGNTALEYKFPGTTSLSTTSGDALGDFYFLITSVNNPEHWIKIHVTQRYDATAAANKADYTVIYATTSLLSSSVKDKYAFTVRVSGNTLAQYFTVKSEIIKWYTNAPTFRSNASANTEKLYIDTTDEGFLYVYYQQSGTKPETPLIAFEKLWNAETNKWEKANATDLQYDNDNVTDLFDFSKGYTISFGSDFDVNTNFSTTVAEDVMPDDAGTDVCFISVNGVKLNDSYNVINFTDSISYDGEVVDEAVDISANDADSKPFIVATTANGGDYAVAGVAYPFNYTKTVAVNWTKSDVSEDDNTLVLQTGIFGNRTVTVLTTSVSGKTYTLVVNGVSTEVTTSNETVILGTEDLAEKVFIGWKIASAQDELYPANYEYTVVEGDTLTAVFVAFDMADGASIRMGTPYGLRFISGYNTVDFDTISGYATVGTLIVPTDMVINDTEINHENFTAVGEKPTMLDIVGEIKLSDAVAQMALTNNYSAECTYYTGTISNLKPANIAREFSARAYIKVTYADATVDYFYSDYDAVNNSRSAYDVAVAAKEDNIEGTALDTYISQTKDLTIANVETTEYESASAITSVRVNKVWVSATEGATVRIGEKDYTVEYNYDGNSKRLLLTFTEVVEQ